MALIDVKFFRSSDTGAPTLSGTAGHLLNVLDACLLNGYNSKTITITRSGTTATATCTTHGFSQHQIVAISGAVEGDYNGDFRITSIPTVNTFTFEVANSPATPATGTITCLVAPARWTQAYSGTNKKVYQQDTSGTARGFLRVDDTGTTHGRMRGYTAMTDVDTGSNPFPTDAQVSGGLYLIKSSTANTTTRTWMIVATKRMIYMFTDSSSTAPLWNQSNTSGFCYGTYKSFVSGDLYPQCIIGNTTSGTTSTNNFYICSQFGSGHGVGHYLASNFANVTFSRTFGTANPVATSGSAGYHALYALPNGPDGKLNLTQYIIHETDTSTVLRGILPGIWQHCLYTPSIINNEIHCTILEASSGSDLEGKRFITFNQYSNQYILIEISDTWIT